MTLDTIVVTGGNGTVGSAILAHLNEHGYTTVNLARGRRRETASDRYVRTDLLDAGETYGALAKADADAIVHVGRSRTRTGTPTSSSTRATSSRACTSSRRPTRSG